MVTVAAIAQLIIVATAAALVRAETYNVTVGAANNLTFTPTHLAANPGDIITFIFQSGSHTATQSTFTSPCTALHGGVDSGPLPPTGALTPSTFNYTVPSSQSVWFFSATAAHCKAGMVFAVNPTANETFADFQAAARGCDFTAKSCIGDEFDDGDSGSDDGGSEDDPSEEDPIDDPIDDPTWNDPTLNDPTWNNNPGTYGSNYGHGHGGGLGFGVVACALIISALLAI